MTLNEAIASMEDTNTHELVLENGELTKWLRELQRYREQERKQALCSYDPDEWYE